VSRHIVGDCGRLSQSITTSSLQRALMRLRIAEARRRRASQQRR
jgi:hypothetical protein